MLDDYLLNKSILKMDLAILIKLFELTKTFELNLLKNRYLNGLISRINVETLTEVLIIVLEFIIFTVNNYESIIF